MNKQLFQAIAMALVCALALQALAWANPCFAATEHFEKVKLLAQNGNKVKKIGIVLRFEDGRLIVSHKTNGNLKSLPYSSIQKATYAHAKNLPPQFLTMPSHASFWRVGNSTINDDRHQPILAHRRLGYYETEAPKLLGMVGAAMLLVGGLIAIALRSGGEKHWLTIQSQEDYIVLQLDKSNKDEYL